VSTTTTRSRVLRSAGLVFAPLLLLGLAACGDDDDGGGDSAGGDTESFCNEVEQISADGDEIDANSADADPEELLDQVGGLVDRMQELDPPAEIEDDWNQALEIMEGLASGSVEDVANFEPTEEQTQAGERVSEFLRDECGLGEDSFLGS
jgi:hypothetical protein